MLFTSRSNQKWIWNVRKMQENPYECWQNSLWWFCFDNLLSVDILNKVHTLFIYWCLPAAVYNATCAWDNVCRVIFILIFLADSGQLHILLFYFFLPSTSPKSGTIASCNVAFGYSLRKLNFWIQKLPISSSGALLSSWMHIYETI